LFVDLESFQRLKQVDDDDEDLDLDAKAVPFISCIPELTASSAVEGTIVVQPAGLTHAAQRHDQIDRTFSQISTQPTMVSLSDHPLGGLQVKLSQLVQACGPGTETEAKANRSSEFIVYILKKTRQGVLIVEPVTAFPMVVGGLSKVRGVTFAQIQAEQVEGAGPEDLIIVGYWRALSIHAASSFEAASDPQFANRFLTRLIETGRSVFEDLNNPPLTLGNERAGKLAWVREQDGYHALRCIVSNGVQREVAARGLGRSQLTILNALLKLRQVCCHPRLLKLGTADSVTGAKLKALMEMLPLLIEEGRSILLFSQFTSMLDIIEEELTKSEIAFVKITGETVDRRTPVERFQAKEVSLFLLSLKAGGTGLNLTAADTVIHYDPWWNPAAEDQATDRAHRIGQTKPVFVYKLIAEGTVEERILLLHEKKKALSKSIYAEPLLGDQSTSISELDLAMLLQPLGQFDYMQQR
jgi:hypothetical protein